MSLVSFEDTNTCDASPKQHECSNAVHSLVILPSSGQMQTVPNALVNSTAMYVLQRVDLKIWLYKDLPFWVKAHHGLESLAHENLGHSHHTVPRKEKIL